MFKEAKTIFDHECFRTVFLETTRDFEFHYNEPTGKEKRYLFLKTDTNPDDYQLDEVIGTAEINPFHPHSIVQPYTDTLLAEHCKIEPFIFETYEIGKLCIKEEYQKMGYITRLFSIMYEHQTNTNARQYLSQMVFPLYETLSHSLELKMHVLGEPDNDKVPGIPVLLLLDEVMSNERLQRILRRKTKIMI